MLKIAGIQMISSPEKERNVEKAIQMIRVASGKGAKIICLQELFSTPWFPCEIDDKHFDLAEETDGITLTALREAARDANCVIIAPFFERVSDSFYNSAAVIGADGEIAGVYRKAHIPNIPLYEERHYFHPGNSGFSVFDVGVARIGIQLGWDNFFPEGTRILAVNGAQIVFSPTAAASLASKTTWEKSISANAIFNGLFIFRVNRVGQEPKQDFYGGSFCVNPEGDFVGKPGGAQEGVLMHSVNVGMTERVRKEWSFLRDRRPDIYHEISIPQIGAFDLIER